MNAWHIRKADIGRAALYFSFGGKNLYFAVQRQPVIKSQWLSSGVKEHLILIIY